MWSAKSETLEKRQLTRPSAGQYTKKQNKEIIERKARRRLHKKLKSYQIPTHVGSGH
jgi:hypothetical protein